MGHVPILGPVVALVAWSLVMMLWMYLTRIPAMGRAGLLGKDRVGGSGATLDGLIEDKVQWKAHNYNHLMEQPTLFYAIALALAVMGHGDGPNVMLAWVYVVLRIGHSLVQATVNIVMIRFFLFLLSSLTLAALTLHAAMLQFG